jgi:hypothetical protein
VEGEVAAEEDAMEVDPPTPTTTGEFGRGKRKKVPTERGAGLLSSIKSSSAAFSSLLSSLPPSSTFLDDTHPPTATTALTLTGFHFDTHTHTRADLDNLLLEAAEQLKAIEPVKPIERPVLPPSPPSPIPRQT